MSRQRFQCFAFLLWAVLGTSLAFGQPASGRYRVSLNLQPGDDVDRVVRQLVATYRGRIEPYAEQGFVGFVVATSEASARLLGQDPHVARIEELNEAPALTEARPNEVIEASPAARPRAVQTNAVPVWTRGPYLYDGSGNIKSIGTGTAFTETFVYDAFGRLRSGTAGPAHTAEYTYDAFGNVLTITKDGQTAGMRTLGVDRATNRMSLLSYNVAGTYDAAGNLISTNSGDQFSWDGLGMMTGSTVAGEQKVYLYTPNDERIAAIKVVSGQRGASEWTLRDGGGAVVRRYSRSATGTWTWTEDYIHQGGKLLAAEVNSSEQRRHFFLDHLGTPRLSTDANGAELSRHDYYPFGEEATPSTSGERRKFTGHERDLPLIPGMLELDYMHARYYSGGWGRFLSVDPLLDVKRSTREPQSWNRYSYVVNNPINRIDPDGRMDGNGMGEPVEWRCPGCTRAEADEQSNQIAKGTAIGAAVSLAVAFGGPPAWKAAGGFLFRHLGATTLAMTLLGGGTHQSLQRAAQSSGPTVQLVTNLTQAPAEGRALSAAVGQGAQALANAARSGEGVKTFTAQIPQALIKGLEAAKLLRISTTQMNGVQATEYRFAPGAAEYIVKFFKEVK